MNLRERILGFFAGAAGFNSAKAVLSEACDGPEESKEALAVLDQLFSIGYLQKKKNGFARAHKAPFVHGRFCQGKGGSGFVEPLERGAGSVFVPSSETLGAYDGDTVLCRVSRGRTMGRGSVVFIVRRSGKKVVGLVSGGYLLPFGSGAPIPLGSRNEEGKVAVALPELDGESAPSELRMIGDPFDLRTVLLAVEARYGLDRPFTPQAEKEAASFGKCFNEEWAQGRQDLRKLPSITIDPRDAKDFDDAISIEKNAGGYRLFVHIADVSFFVRENGALDREAMERGNSVYLPSTVYPMLPHGLSNGLCSLGEGEDKLCVTVEMDADGQGRIAGSRFYGSVIRSMKRLCYEEAEAILEGASGFDPEVERTVKESWELASALNAKRAGAGALDFDLPEARLELREEKAVEAVFPEVRLRSHRLIEEFMLAANESVAAFLAKKKAPFLYRVHEEPDMEKLDSIIPLLGTLGVAVVSRKGRVSAKDLQQAIGKAAGKPFERLVAFKILRAMMRARYSEKPGEHYGLALPKYCHFTSPIRRYPDLTVHRALKDALDGRRVNPQKLARIAEHTNETERTADDAEREAVEWLVLIYLRERIGDEFRTLVTSFTRFGVKLELVDELIEGVCPFSMMDDDHYLVDREGFFARGRHTGRTLRVGQVVTAQLVRIDLFNKEAQFRVV